MSATTRVPKHTSYNGKDQYLTRKIGLSAGLVFRRSRGAHEGRPHDALEGRTPAECMNQNAKNFTFELSP